MAFSEPDVYLNALVRPMLGRFEAEPTAFDLAISCTILIYQYSDVLAQERGISLKDAVAELSSRVEEFVALSAIANSAKHVELSRHPMKEMIGLRAEHLTINKSAAFSDGTYYSDGTSFSDHPDVVYVKTPDGNHHDLLYLCKTVYAALTP